MANLECLHTRIQNLWLAVTQRGKTTHAAMNKASALRRSLTATAEALAAEPPACTTGSSSYANYG